MSYSEGFQTTPDRPSRKDSLETR